MTIGYYIRKNEFGSWEVWLSREGEEDFRLREYDKEIPYAEVKNRAEYDMFVIDRFVNKILKVGAEFYYEILHG